MRTATVLLGIVGLAVMLVGGIVAGGSWFGVGMAILGAASVLLLVQMWRRTPPPLLDMLEAGEGADEVSPAISQVEGAAALRDRGAVERKAK